MQGSYQNLSCLSEGITDIGCDSTIASRNSSSIGSFSDRPQRLFFKLQCCKIKRHFLYFYPY